MDRAIRLAAMACALALAACASSRVSTQSSVAPLPHPVRAIAFAPGGGLLADAVGIELANRGFNVVDTAEATNMLVRTGLTETEIAQPAGLAALRERNIDAVLVVKTADAPNGTPQSASARMTSTHTGQMIGGVTWQNGWGGMAGSPADRIMRQDLGDAANEIADELAKRLR